MTSSPFDRPAAPDWEGFLKCITRKGEPERVHPIELFLDAEVKDAVCERFDLTADLDRGDPWYEQKREIALQRFLGYDYVLAGLKGLEMLYHEACEPIPDPVTSQACKDAAAFRYKVLIFAEHPGSTPPAHNQLEAGLATMDQFYGTAERDRARQAEALLRRAARMAPLDARVQQTLLDFYRDRAIAEAALHDTSEEFRAAQEIQQRLFPVEAPRLDGFDIAGALYPAKATAGDYFDYIPMLETCTGIVLGDVSSHGMGPALLMAETRACLRALSQTYVDVGEILTRTNHTLAADTHDFHFVTLTLARLDPSNASLVYAAAGHRGYLLDPSGEVISKCLCEEEEMLMADLDMSLLAHLRSHRMRYFLPHRRTGIYQRQ